MPAGPDRKFIAFLAIGLSGMGLNVATTFFLCGVLGIHYAVAYAAGCWANVSLNKLLYVGAGISKSVFDGRTAPIKTNLLVPLIILVYVATEYVELHYMTSVLIVTVVVAGVDYIVSRHWYFPVPQLAIKEYEGLEGDYYDKRITEDRNPLRSWFHTSRQKITDRLVRESYKEGMRIVDLCCGSCVWNTGKLPVLGVDANSAMGSHAMKEGRLTGFHQGDVLTLDLPAASFDIAVFTEALEHMEDPRKVLAAIRRLLKPGGVLILSVPHDTTLSLWRPLFGLECLVKGDILGDAYYKHRCGHIHHFSPRAIRTLLAGSGFTVRKQFTNFRMNFFTVAAA